MKGHWVKFTIGFILVGGYAIIIASGIKYGWHEGIGAMAIILPAVGVIIYFINRQITKE